MNNTKEQKGDWEHKCPRCKEIFTGRKNRIYCYRNCKTIVNNEKKAERRKLLEPSFKKMETALRIFLELPEEKLGIKFPLSELTSKGFDPNIPTGRFKSKKTGTEYQTLLHYCYNVTDGGTHIIIYNLNQ